MSGEVKHCATCICSRRAPVQGEHRGIQTDRSKPLRGPGTIEWQEHLLAYVSYSARYGTDQSAERLAERGGFSYQELITLLGREPTSWQPRRNTEDKV